MANPPRRVWRRFGTAGALAAALAGIGLGTVFAAAASAAPAPPAPGVAPGVAAVSAAENAMFYTAADGTVWEKNVAGTPGVPVVQVSNGRLVSAPSPVYTGTTLVVFGQGTDNQLWYSYRQSNGTWADWGNLGGKLTAKPAAVALDSTGDHYSVYVRSADGAVWARDHTAAGWGSWRFVGGQVLAGTGPAAALTGAGPVFAVAGTDHQVYLYGRTGTQSGFVDFGGQTTSSPGVTAVGTGNVAVFVRGTDNAAWDRESTLPIAPSSPWRSLGGILTSGVAADTGPTGTTYLLGLGTDSQVWMRAGTWPNLGDWLAMTG